MYTKNNVWNAIRVLNIDFVVISEISLLFLTNYLILLSGLVIIKMEQGKCVICNDAEYDGSDLICIREKGSEGINDAAKKRGDNIVTDAGQFVHIKCRQKYIRPYHIKNL